VRIEGVCGTEFRARHPRSRAASAPDNQPEEVVLKKFSVRAFAAVLVVLSSAPASATTTIKIATVAPQDSPWGKDLKQWAKDVAEDTAGEAEIDFQWNAQAGDESLMVQKMRTGQIDGALVTPLGLGQTGVNDVFLFALPGLFTSWQKVDSARVAVKDDLARQFEQKGFTVVGWSDVGILRQMTAGFEIHHPSDLRGKGVFFYSGDPITPKLYSTIGGITAKQLMLTEVLPYLTQGTVNVITAPPLGAEQLQWASHLDHISTQTISYAIGALIMASPRVSSLPPKIKTAVLTRGAEACDRLQKKIRYADAQAFARMKTSKVAYEPTAADVAEWTPIFQNLAKQLRGTVFTPALFDKVVELSGNPMAK
jgi:TRAP-type C4-dicarboxylate transport system substrate-binding protein